MPYAAHVLNAFILAVLLIDCLRRSQIPFPMARPTERRDHIGLVPLIGGLGMFMAFILALSLLDRSLIGQSYLISGLLVLVTVGVVDDFVELRPSFKLVAQFSAAALMIIPNGRVLDIGNLLGVEGVQLGPLELLVSLCFVVGLTNAINMIDGVDGLAGGIVAAILFWLAMIASALGRPTEVAIILILLAATIGFLAFNVRTPWRPRASVFMGDAGSMMLGACVAYFTLMLAAAPAAGSGSTAHASLPALCWLISIPVIDTLSLAIRRPLAGKSPFAADRWHIHHLMLSAGWSSAQVTGLLVGLSLLLGGIGFAGVVFGIPAWTMALGLLLIAAAHTVVVSRLSMAGIAPRPGVAQSNAPGIL